jgi:hypothetical protein
MITVRQLIKRKTTFNSIMDVGLFWVPSQSQFVTWEINKQAEPRDSEFGCINGHYYLAHEYDAARRDFERRG